MASSAPSMSGGCSRVPAAVPASASTAASRTSIRSPRRPSCPPALVHPVARGLPEAAEFVEAAQAPLQRGVGRALQVNIQGGTDGQSALVELPGAMAGLHVLADL